MPGLLSALQFLTIIPAGPSSTVDENKISYAAAYFPLIGLFLGLILAIINKLLLAVSLDAFLVSVILVTLLVILTGGLHLDGLADTFDALFSRKNRSEMLQIMRDSRIGTMGVLSLICIILLKVSFLCSLHPKVVNVSLVLACLLSRYSLVLMIFLFPYAREKGKAEPFFKGMNRKIFFLATVITLLCLSLIWGLKGLIVFFILAIFVILLGKFIARKIGGMTGDTLGAINELSEVLVLLSVLILSRVWI